MKNAQDGLRKKLEQIKMKKAIFPVVCNADATPHTDPEKLKDNLIAQLTKPVLWEQCIMQIKENGIKGFAELGAGRVLSGLLRRIERQLSVTSVRDIASLEKSVDFFKAEGYLES